MRVYTIPYASLTISISKFIDLGIKRRCCKRNKTHIKFLSKTEPDTQVDPYCSIYETTPRFQKISFHDW